MITHCRQANEEESELIMNQSRWGMLIKRNGATKEAIHGNCHVAYQTDDCCGPHDGMVALADDWYSDCSPDNGLMLCIEDKQTLSARMLGRLDRPGTESSWLYEASAACPQRCLGQAQLRFER